MVINRVYPSHPLIGVGAVVLTSGKILLVKRASPPGKGKWSIPGGLVEVGEPLVRAVLRELYEETMVKGEVVGLVDVFEYIEFNSSGRAKYHYVILDFLVEPHNTDIKASSDVVDAGFYDLDYAISKLTLTKTTKRLLNKILSQGLKVIEHVDVLDYST